MKVDFFDSITNWWTSLGSPLADKSQQSQYSLNMLDRGQLEFAYRGDWLARKIVDIPPYDASREWRGWQADADDITRLEAEERRLNLQFKTRDWLAKARLYGGAALVMGVDIGRPEDELRIDAVRQGSLKYVHVLHRFNLSAGTLITDLNNPYFGEPEYYQLSTAAGSLSSGVRIHPSRVIKGVGAEVPEDAVGRDAWGGDSVLVALDQAIKNVPTVTQAVAVMVHEANFDIIKIPGLSENISSAEYKTRLTNRMLAMMQNRSIIRAVVGDTAEQWERIKADFTGLPDLLRLFLLIASGASDIPATRLLGQSPAGLSATGESDTRNYYDRISADQRVIITPKLNRLDEVMIRSALGDRDLGIFYEWNSLWQMSDKEKAEIDKSKADTYKIDVETNSMPIEVLQTVRQNQLIEDGIYPGLEQALEEAEAIEPPEVEETLPAEAAGGEEGAPGGSADPPARDGRAFADFARHVIRRMHRDAKPRTLYVRRDLLNADALIAWARDAGFVTTLPAAEMHVTIAFSRAALDWTKVYEGDLWSPGMNEEEARAAQLRVRPGGMRLVEPLGPNGAVVLMFASASLCSRHESIRYAGASWDWDHYQPHVTITWNDPRRDEVGYDQLLRQLEPYRGELLFGPEIFEEVDEGFRERIVEVAA